MSVKSIVMMGATGAVGSEVVRTLISLAENGDPITQLTLLGRRAIDDFEADYVRQGIIDVLDPSSYLHAVLGHDTAICTLGVGQPSKISKDEWLRIDKTAVLDFAKTCKEGGVQHFQILTSVGSDAESKSFYLRVKGELEKELEALEFETLSIFQPSMILTPKNRYGVSQAITLAVWPILGKLMMGSMNKYRGIEVSKLGAAIAKNSFTSERGVQRFQWRQFVEMSV